MKTAHQNTSLQSQHHKGWISTKWDWLKSREGKEAFITITVMLTILLFMYTAVSKLLQQSVFVFQMRRAPLPLMQTLAPIIGWAVPIIELMLVALLFINRTRLLGMVCSLILMVSFEVYITGMKIMEMQTGVRLPCTCGGIISNMGWTAHLLFNAVFIILLGLSIYYDRKLKKPETV